MPDMPPMARLLPMLRSD